MLDEICTILGDVKTVPFISNYYGFSGLNIGQPRRKIKGNFRGKIESHNFECYKKFVLYENKKYFACFIDIGAPAFIDNVQLHIYIHGKELKPNNCKVILQKQSQLTTSEGIGMKNAHIAIEPLKLITKTDYETKLSAIFPNFQKSLGAYSVHKLRFLVLIDIETFFFFHTELQYDYLSVGKKSDREKICAALNLPLRKNEKKLIKCKKPMQVPNIPLRGLDAIANMQEAHRIFDEIEERKLSTELQYFLDEAGIKKEDKTDDSIDDKTEETIDTLCCKVVAENKEVINRNEPELQIRTVDFLRGEIDRKTRTIAELRESGATERDKRFLALLQDPKYVPSEMDFTTLVLTLNSLARLDLLTKMMKRFRVVTTDKDPFKYDFQENNEIGLLYKKEQLKIVSNYEITPNMDGTFFYKTNFSIPILRTDMDALFDLSFSINFDLSEILECKIELENVSPYAKEKYVPFRKLEKESQVQFQSPVYPELLIPFNKETKAKARICFVATEKIMRPILSVSTNYTEVVLVEEVSDLWGDAQLKLRITKKANGVLELTKLENGTVREQQVVFLQGGRGAVDFFDEDEI